MSAHVNLNQVYSICGKSKIKINYGNRLPNDPIAGVEGLVSR